MRQVDQRKLHAVGQFSENARAGHFIGIMKRCHVGPLQAAVFHRLECRAQDRQFDGAGGADLIVGAEGEGRSGVQIFRENGDGSGKSGGYGGNLVL